MCSRPQEVDERLENATVQQLTTWLTDESIVTRPNTTKPKPASGTQQYNNSISHSLYPLAISTHLPPARRPELPSLLYHLTTAPTAPLQDQPPQPRNAYEDRRDSAVETVRHSTKPLLTKHPSHFTRRPHSPRGVAAQYRKHFETTSIPNEPTRRGRHRLPASIWQLFVLLPATAPIRSSAPRRLP